MRVRVRERERVRVRVRERESESERVRERESERVAKQLVSKQSRQARSSPYPAQLGAVLSSSCSPARESASCGT